MNENLRNRNFINIEGLKSGLKALEIKAEDSCDFEEILNNAIRALYQAQPIGQENYGNNKPRVGIVRLYRFNSEDGPGNADINYSLSGQYYERWKYIQMTIGTVNLRERTYTSKWDYGQYNEAYHQIPEVLMRDTERVMECLGLARKQKE